MILAVLLFVIIKACFLIPHVIPTSDTQKAAAMKTIALLAAAQLASAHFGIEYPEWRANTLSEDNPQYSQWTNPCKSPFPPLPLSPHPPAQDSSPK